MSDQSMSEHRFTVTAKPSSEVDKFIQEFFDARDAPRRELEEIRRRDDVSRQFFGLVGGLVTALVALGMAINNQDVLDVGLAFSWALSSAHFIRWIAPRPV